MYVVQWTNFAPEALSLGSDGPFSQNEDRSHRLEARRHNTTIQHTYFLKRPYKKKDLQTQRSMATTARL